MPSQQNAFTLVAYLPEPLRSWLVDLRRTLALAVTSEPHLTLLPPRPLSLPVEEAIQRLSAILNGWHTFNVELSDLRVFAGSNVLFLEINEGSRTMERLHAELNRGDFAHEEAFQFHPHVTVGGLVDPLHANDTLRRAADAWERSECSSRFKVEDLVLVEISEDATRGDGRRLWEYSLAANDVSQLDARAASPV